jgi:hypothetical protein
MALWPGSFILLDRNQNLILDLWILCTPVSNPEDKLTSAINIMLNVWCWLEYLEYHLVTPRFLFQNVLARHCISKLSYCYLQTQLHCMAQLLHCIILHCLLVYAHSDWNAVSHVTRHNHLKPINSSWNFLRFVTKVHSGQLITLLSFLKVLRTGSREKQICLHPQSARLL